MRFFVIFLNNIDNNNNINDMIIFLYDNFLYFITVIVNECVSFENHYHKIAVVPTKLDSSHPVDFINKCAGSLN